MKILSIMLALALVVAFSVPAVAEVEEITVGGSIVVRGQILTPGLAWGQQQNGSSSFWANDDNSDFDWYTQRTRVNVDAKLSGGVRGFVELQAYDFWGAWDNDGEEWLPEAEDMELWGYDGEVFAGQGNPMVVLYQAYIEMNDIADYPLRLRIGRQEMAFGREWLVGNNDAGMNFSGLSFDAIRLTYEDDLWTVDAWTAKLDEMSSPVAMGWMGSVEEDADIDFHGLYATYKGVENMVIDGYLLWRRNAMTRWGGFAFSGNTEDVQNLFTVGGRVAGEMELGAGILDYNVEGALQLGDANIAVVSNNSGDYEGFAFNALVGYTFTDVQYTPRVDVEYAYFSGPDGLFDDNDVGTFVRLFSDVHYGELNLGQNLDIKATNLHILRLGASAEPVEKLTVEGDLYGFWLAEDDAASGGVTFGIPQFSRSGTPDDGVGWELDLAAEYQYTEDLNLRVGWAHFFVGDAFENAYGDGVNDDDIDYLYVQAALTF